MPTLFDEKLKDFKKQFEAIPKRLPLFVIDSLDDKESQLEDLNISQLKKGIDSNSEDILPEYTQFTKDIKAAKGQPTDRVTLEDEGDFHSSITFDLNLDEIVYYATDEKTDKLLDKYGDNVLGLNKKSRIEVKELILEDLYSIIKKWILSQK